MALQEKKIEEIRKLALEGLDCDGSHHKQWYLEEILKIVIPGIILEELDCDRGRAP